jgi:hypothetical protein
MRLCETKCDFFEKNVSHKSKKGSQRCGPFCVWWGGTKPDSWFGSILVNVAFRGIFAFSQSACGGKRLYYSSKIESFSYSRHEISTISKQENKTDAHVCRHASAGNGSLCRPPLCGPFVRIGLYGAWVVCPYLFGLSRASCRKDIQPHAFFLCGKNARTREIPMSRLLFLAWNLDNFKTEE